MNTGWPAKVLLDNTELYFTFRLTFGVYRLFGGWGFFLN